MPPHPSSPQAKEMADESMVRNLAAQIEAIWPQEEPIFRRYGLPPPGEARVLDVGCGTGEVIPRLADLFPQASFVGVDLEEPHLERARRRSLALGERVRFQKADALDLPFEAGSFDLVLSRHLVHALSDAAQALQEMKRVAKSGARLHLLAEDYGMLWCHPTPLGSDGFWQRVAPQYEKSVGGDLHVGRKMFTLLSDLSMTAITVDYVVVDTVRVPRETFARIWEAWRDGYTDSIAEHTDMPREEVVKRWSEMIDCLRDPRGYALWQVPVWSARKP